MNIFTSYMGLELPSPIIAGSCGLTSSLSNLIKLEESGVGAVVLKSLFEEQITIETNKASKSLSFDSAYQESYDYLERYMHDNTLNKYLSLIREAKAKLKIPVIASINCFSFSEWLSFAKQIEEAGADALELNIFILPSDVNLSHEDIESLYSNIISALKKTLSIPVAIKTGSYFTEMAKFMQRLSWMGIRGLVLFNRFYSPDIDIERFIYKPTNIFSAPEEFPNTLRWTSILSSLLKCDISATTGVKTGEDVVKLLLAGAQTIQIASCLYENGLEYVEFLNEELKDWMSKHNFSSLNDFRGKMSIKSYEHPASILRVQFMKYFSGIE